MFSLRFKLHERLAIFMGFLNFPCLKAWSKDILNNTKGWTGRLISRLSDLLTFQSPRSVEHLRRTVDLSHFSRNGPKTLETTQNDGYVV